MTGIQSQTTNVPVLCVAFKTPAGERELKFSQTFQIGRIADCDVCIPDEYVSRRHAEVLLEGNQWLLRDLNSGNGIFLNGQRVTTVPINRKLSVRLGIEGPFVNFSLEQPKPDPGSQTLMSHYIDHYFNSKDEGQAGEHTLFVRKAFASVRNKQRRRYQFLFAALAVVVLASLSYALYERQIAIRQKSLAEDIFYNMKSLDVDIAGVEKLVSSTNNHAGIQEIHKYQQRRHDMEKSYDNFLNTLHVYDPKITEEQRLILKVARIFGECEIDTPPAFVSEVKTYVDKWKSNDRLPRAIALANKNGYSAKISEELIAQDLPPQFFYLALQESDFDPYSSGPATSSGIAKGMWQFIPETGIKYGLRMGPLVDLPKPDPRDERNHWDLETKAAAKYLNDLYSTDAQASGLLVMACYNWGENRVIPMVRAMPANPRDRNFWRLLALHRKQIPQETYDYVFSIFSAAVIGENPRLFGFNFDNPLAHSEK